MTREPEISISGQNPLSVSTSISPSAGVTPLHPVKIKIARPESQVSLLKYHSLPV